MKKRNESSIVTAILRYLQVLENNKKIAWVDRLNSGRIVFKRGNRFQSIRMCRPGTPDIYVLLNTGGVLWLECKNSGKQETEQYQFEKLVSNFLNHRYSIVRSVDDVMRILKGIQLTDQNDIPHEYRTQGAEYYIARLKEARKLPCICGMCRQLIDEEIKEEEK